MFRGRTASYALASLRRASQAAAKPSARSAERIASDVPKPSSMVKRVSTAIFATGTCWGLYWLFGPREGEAMLDEESRDASFFTHMYDRASGRVRGLMTEYANPMSDKLLKDQQAPMKTLVLGLEDVLIHSHWSRDHGWRHEPRPGTKAFLAAMAQMYEIVVFSNHSQFYADEMLQKIDPLGMYISHRLYRDDTRYVDGTNVKDLSLLNRDMSQVVVLDSEDVSIAGADGNRVHVSKYQPREQDAKKQEELLRLAPFLESLVMHRVPDVRPVITAFDGKSVPDEYRRRHREYVKKVRAERSSSAIGAAIQSGMAK